MVSELANGRFYYARIVGVATGAASLVQVETAGVDAVESVRAIFCMANVSRQPLHFVWVMPLCQPFNAFLFGLKVFERYKKVIFKSLSGHQMCTRGPPTGG